MKIPIAKVGSIYFILETVAREATFFVLLLSNFIYFKQETACFFYDKFDRTIGFKISNTRDTKKTIWSIQHETLLSVPQSDKKQKCLRLAAFVSANYIRGFYSYMFF